MPRPVAADAAGAAGVAGVARPAEEERTVAEARQPATAPAEDAPSPPTLAHARSHQLLSHGADMTPIDPVRPRLERPFRRKPHSGNTLRLHHPWWCGLLAAIAIALLTWMIDSTQLNIRLAR